MQAFVGVGGAGVDGNPLPLSQSLNHLCLLFFLVGSRQAHTETDTYAHHPHCCLRHRTSAAPHSLPFVPFVHLITCCPHSLSLSTTLLLFSWFLLSLPSPWTTSHPDPSASSSSTPVTTHTERHPLHPTVIILPTDTITR